MGLTNLQFKDYSLSFDTHPYHCNRIGLSLTYLCKCMYSGFCIVKYLPESLSLVKSVFMLNLYKQLRLFSLCDSERAQLIIEGQN